MRANERVWEKNVFVWCAFACIADIARIAFMFFYLHLYIRAHILHDVQPKASVWKEMVNKIVEGMVWSCHRPCLRVFLVQCNHVQMARV